MTARGISSYTWALIATGVAGLVTSWGICFPISASMADPAPAASSYHGYDPDPNHLWNRLHQALHVRLEPPDTGDDEELDAFLWHDSEYFSSGTGYKAALDVLNEFIAKQGEKLIQEPRKRALLQRDLWAFFDTLPTPRWLKKSPELELATRAAQIMRRLALSADQIKVLPDTLKDSRLPNQSDQTQPTAEFRLADLWDANGPWVLLGDKDYLPMALIHTQFFGGRSAFFLFLRLPGGREQTLKYIASGDRGSLPDGTQVALLRQMQLIDDQGKLKATRVTETLQLRVYGALRQVSFEFKLNRRDFLAGKPDLEMVGTEDRERAYLLFMGYNKANRRAPIMRTCSQCHQGHGLTSELREGFQKWPLAPHSSPRVIATSRDEEESRQRMWKSQRYEWGLLQGLVQDR